MTAISALPAIGDVVFDARDDQRSLRVEWVARDGLLVLSFWRAGRCAASCQIRREDVPGLIAELARGLLLRPVPSWSQPRYAHLRPRVRRAAWLRERLQRG